MEHCGRTDLARGFVLKSHEIESLFKATTTVGILDAVDNLPSTPNKERDIIIVLMIEHIEHDVEWPWFGLEPPKTHFVTGLVTIGDTI